MLSLESSADDEKLQKVNSFFNRKIQYKEDINLWRKADYWATPLETIGRLAGDCEDFSIAKYTFLKLLNIPNEKLRLTYVQAEVPNADSSSKIAHMVLSYYATPYSEPLILDNLTSEILLASARPDLKPIFSFNDKQLWVGSQIESKIGSQSNLSKWELVLLRIKADGLF